MATQRYVEGVVDLAYDTEQCIGCSICTMVCPHAVFVMDGKRARLQDAGACMECGACAENCPASAISVEKGVGCSKAFIIGAIRGTEPTCDCAGGPGSC